MSQATASNKEIAISQASAILGVSLDTIRRWEKKGLIKSRGRAQGMRIFHEGELRTLNDKLNGHQASEFKTLSAKTKTKFTVIELFAGAGGTALGLENAGLQTTALVEIDPIACASLKYNKPNWNIITEDIRKVNFKGMGADVVAGGFPCQSFSYAGKGQGFEDTRGTLFFDYARAIKEIQPKVIMGENVRGLVMHDQGRTLKTMMNTLEELGYRAEYRILRAQYLDVPQKRERLVIIGVRNDLDIPIIFPKERDYTVGLREALKDVPYSTGQSYTDKKHRIMSLIPEGGYWRDLPIELQKEYMGASFFHTGGRTGMARRLSWDEPSLTLTCNPAQKQTERCHPSETRPLTVREYARIQSFPDNWIFKGSTANQYKQIGNAVPVNMAYHIGECLVAMLSGTHDTENTDIIYP